MHEEYEAIKNELQDELVLYSQIALNNLTADTESIAIRSMPTNAAGVDYQRSKPRMQLFQILTKSTNQKRAMNTLESIAEHLNALVIDAAAGLIICEVYAEPRYLETTDKKEFIFTAAFKAEIERG